MKKLILPALAAGLLFSCQSKVPSTPKTETAVTPTPEPAAIPRDFRGEADKYLREYSAAYQKFYYKASEAEWASNTRIIPGDSTNAKRTQAANEEMARFTGSEANINKTRELLAHKDKLTYLQVLQLEAILFQAANNPQIVPHLVNARIKAQTEQTEKLYGYDYKLNGKSVTTNQLDDILKDEKNLNKRLQAWNTSKEVGKELKDGLVNLRDLRNQTVQALGYEDFFSYQASEYGMTREEMVNLIRKLNQELLPLYRELHTYARYELAKKYGVKQVPDQIPAHWLPNRWGQDWSSMVTVKGFNLDAQLKKKSVEWQAKQAEKFYMSLGFPALPETFWTKSDLYPLPKGANYKKNNHASAWHMDLDKDVRGLMSIEPNAEWYETTHHEYGHIYYYMTYSNPDVPLMLRAGANRAYHEALGSLMGLAASQKPFLASLNLIDPKAKTDDMQLLLKEALNYVVFIPFASGVMTEFEHDLYAQNLPTDEFNKRWWELVKNYQGIVPPNTRGEEFTDAATKTHINDDPAQYYDYALSYVILFQLHDHIAKNILKQDPHATNYYGSREVGAFLKGIMYPGASANWRKMLIEKTGEDLSARAMVAYFEPLMDYLKKQNKGRKYTM
ncbi:M2 family metallopeptidase [Adhaeribacter sp. BT258]|uniref:M2 family metallopeptidase n=1 Tax=Adhaeribacter terrigena TaxID=2793070 RepID=A0ABS1C3K7_9BACT|nr:M2 family metallopeptidase [Adhaeribacter terrigena]MBK0403130.1 M2 family metallopeptidase [Adhaeribacter terrigena]